MNRILIALLALGVMGAAVPAFAGDGSSGPSGSCAVCSKTTSDSWVVKTSSQLARGAANTGGCWLELVNQPMKEMKEGTRNPMIGVAKGVGHTCLRLVKGVGEIITAPLPNAKDGSQIATNCPMCMWSA